MKKYLIILFSLLLTGCGVFQSKRENLIPSAPRLDYKQEEKIKELAKVNDDLASKIRINGTEANSIESVTLSNGTKIMVRFVGTPFQDIDGNDVRLAEKVTADAKRVVEDYNKEQAKYEDTLNGAREKQINKINTYWDWKKLLGGGIFTWIIAIVAVPILGAIFPVIIPVVSLIYQLFKAGLSAFSVVAKLGVGGMVSIVKAIERYREENKNTPEGKKFDDHMSKQLDMPVKDSLDKFKNNFNI